MAHVVMVYVDMANTAMAYIVMAHLSRTKVGCLYSYGPCSHGLCGCGQYSYGLYSHDLVHIAHVSALVDTHVFTRARLYTCRFSLAVQVAPAPPGQGYVN